MEGSGATIYDIAKLAGVSIATVSRVVNGSPSVSEKTRQKVLDVMAQCSYTPNAFARGLGLGTMKTVGIVCPDVADPFMAKAVSYLERNLRGYGYDCILCGSGESEESRAQSVQLVLKKQVDALVLVGSVFSDVPAAILTPASQTSGRIPVFMVNGFLENESSYCVLADEYQAVYNAVEELLANGRKHILFLGAAHNYSANRKRQGYEDALAAHGYPREERPVLYAKNTVFAARDLLLRQRGLPFDSVIAAEDALAVGAVKYAAARGLRIPDDISVIGFNNSELAICCEPELTSIDNHGEILCRKTIDSLMELLAGREIPHRQTVPCRLVRRATTDF